MAGTTQLDVIKNFMASLDQTAKQGKAALDEAIKACSYEKFTSWQDAIDQFISDNQSANGVTDFAKDYCGIIFDNPDTGAITGSDAGGATAKTATSIVPESTTPENWTMPTIGGTDTYSGLTVHWQPSSTQSDYGDLTDAQQYILKGLHSEWIPRSLELISESFGYDFWTVQILPCAIFMYNLKIPTTTRLPMSDTVTILLPARRLRFWFV